jgi:NAD(P)-dependent dehydrogenase (short-subunit alcohol dehydrogenase family)
MNARKVVLVTGTSGGIGKACALRLARNGFQVFATVRRESDGAALKNEARDGVTPIVMDVTDGTSIRQAFDRIFEQAKDGLHGLVNNAGIVSVWPLEFFPLEEFRKTLETNLTGVLAVIQTFLPLLRRGHGRIVNISSSQDTVPAPFMGAYAASKCGLVALSEVLRTELHSQHIDVILLVPGSIATPIWHRIFASYDKAISSMGEDATALYGKQFRRVREAVGEMAGRGLPAERVAAAVERALSDAHPRLTARIGLDALMFRLVAAMPPRLRLWTLRTAFKLPD